MSVSTATGVLDGNDKKRGMLGPSKTDSNPSCFGGDAPTSVLDRIGKDRGAGLGPNKMGSSPSCFAGEAPTGVLDGIGKNGGTKQRC